MSKILNLEGENRMLDFHKERYLQKINHRLAKFPVETEFSDKNKKRA
jgi:hypothetical protein